MNFIYQPNRIYAVDETGRLIAEITFPGRSGRVVEITHTFVDDSLRGQGIAGKMMEALAQKLRSENKKAVPVCSYAVRWFETHSEASDLRAEP